MENMQNKCSCGHHSMTGVFIIIFGLIFLLQALGIIGSAEVNLAWPIVVILAGMMKVIERSACKCC